MPFVTFFSHYPVLKKDRQQSTKCVAYNTIFDNKHLELRRLKDFSMYKVTISAKFL